jgi:hypothetical protein
MSQQQAGEGSSKEQQRQEAGNVRAKAAADETSSGYDKKLSGPNRPSV